ncbi:MAG: TIM23 complex component [Phylliscum demangeonii]|nr:MAG: TIM23 complex component [Phylliscum demangeonii]
MLSFNLRAGYRVQAQLGTRRLSSLIARPRSTSAGIQVRQPHHFARAASSTTTAPAGPLSSGPPPRSPSPSSSSPSFTNETRPPGSNDVPPTMDTPSPTTTTPSPTPTSTPTPTLTSLATRAVQSEENLDWNTFFRLRKVRRRYHLAASALSCVATTGTGIVVLSQIDLDAWSGGQLIFGMDPVVLLGILALASGSLGWLAGPFLGNAVFNRMVNKGFRKQMAHKERGFYARIKRHRVDPSSQSVSNPVPDYYGEKIASVAGYRQWLKDQKVYNKRREGLA